MKKLTKTQKNILKKKVLRIAIIIGLIVGGLSFLVVLYAIIAGSLNSTVPETSDISEEVLERPNVEQRALTPPTSYDLELSPYAVGAVSYFVWQDNQDDLKDTALFNENIATIDYYSNSYYWHSLTITTNVYAPTTTMGSNEDDMFYFNGDYLGSSSSSPAFSRFSIILDNRNSANSFLFYGDFSSSAQNVSADVFLYDNDNNTIGYLSHFTSWYNAPLRPYYVPPFSRLAFYFSSTTSTRYLDALYIDDIGATAYDIGFEDGDDHGYEFGYDDGYENGYDDGVIDGYDQGYTHGEEDGYTEGYSEGHTDGYISGYDFGLISTEGYPEGYNAGFSVGYDSGYIDGLEVAESEGAIENAFDLIYAGAQSVDKILSISVFGSITLGMLLFTPLIIGISLAVIKIIKG